MKENETPAPGGNRERAEAEMAAALAGSTAIPNKQFITHRGTIASVLCTGKQNALTGREIRRILDLRNTREVTSRVETERQGGAVICATTGRTPGYFIPANLNELEEYNRSLHRRIKNVTATLDAMQRAADDWSGQQRIDLEDGGGCNG